MGFTPHFGSRGWFRMDSEKEDVSETNVAVDNVEMFEETIADLKQNKARSKTVFTKARRRLLVLIQENITVEKIDEECEQLEMLMEELLEVTGRLSAKYKLEKDSKSNDKLSSEIEQIEIEFTDAQNRAQRIRDELRNREVYCKFVEQLNKEQPVLVDKEIDSLSMQSQSKINSLSMQSNPKVIEKGEKSQSPICENIEQQPRSLRSQVEDLESFSQANTSTQWKVSEPSRVTSTMMPQYMVNHHPVVLDAANPGNRNSQSNLLVGNNAIPNVSNSTLISQDMWKQLKRVSVPIYLHRR